VALVCVAASALLSSYLSHREIGQFVQQHRSELVPQSVPGNPRQNPFPNPNRQPGQPPSPPPPQPRNINLSFILAGVLGLVLALVLSLVLAGRISKPLSGLTAATRKIADGEYKERVEVGGGREVEELSDAFNALSENLEKNEVLRQNMVADIAHELRNPLATLRGQLELLQDGTIPYSKEVVDSLMEDAILLSRIVEDLRQLSLADAGKIEFSFQAVDAAQTLNDVFARFEHEAAGRGVKLEPVPGDEVPPVRADPSRLAQILGNLVGNSITHTPRDGTITAGVRRSGAFVVFTVDDTGAGLTAEELPHIFDRLYRTDKSRARSTGGAGLGLSIAKSLVEAQGGRIWAESESGRGTAIHFTIPVYQA